MVKVTINGKICLAEKGERLINILNKNQTIVSHPCGGNGKCGKCKVKVNGEELLSCRYTVESDITVETPENLKISTENKIPEANELTENMCYVADIGTTSISLALISIDSKKIIAVKSCINPQISFGADVISRINYCSENGISHLQKTVVNAVNELINSFNLNKKIPLIVSANTTMLHIFAGENPKTMGVAPYTPVFLKKRRFNGEKIGLKNISEVTLLPSIGTFVGADLVSGINYIKLPPENKYYLLCDLGTNAEIILFSKENILCTAAAAGPCFEGVNISHGMSATTGAINEFYPNLKYKTVENASAVGICGTGLVDIIAVLLKKGIIDKTGYMEYESFEVAPNVFLTDADVRQYQLAKSAVYSGILTLISEMGITFDDVQTLFVAGGFSTKFNAENATFTGLIPKELFKKCKSIGNSSLYGAIDYATEKKDLSYITDKAHYIDLAKSTLFSQLFIENMGFENTI